MTAGAAERLDRLAVDAPDVVAAYLGIEEGRSLTVRREVRRRAGPGTAEGMVRQLAATADALSSVVGGLPPAAIDWPGGEADWNVAQTIGHVATARSGLVLAASLAAQGRWPADAPVVVPGLPGSADADVPALIARIGQSQRIVERAARAVAGHETDACPLDHPLVGRLRCGEWLLFAGVHDLMHVDQLEQILSDHGMAV